MKPCSVSIPNVTEKAKGAVPPRPYKSDTSIRTAITVCHPNASLAYFYILGPLGQNYDVSIN